MKVKIIQRVLYILLMLFCVGFYIYDVAVNHADPTKNLSKFVLVVACCIIGIMRGEMTRKRADLSFYEKGYAKELGNAFISDEKNRKELLMATRYYDENKLNKAVKVLEKLKANCRQSDDFYAVGLFLALSLTDMKLYDAAIKEYEELLALRLETSTIYNNLGQIYSAIGKRQDAISCYEKSIALSPEYEFAYVNTANLYFAEKDFDSAIENALKALEINSKQKAAANLLAIVYALREDKENADKYYHIAIANGSAPTELKNAIEYYRISEE